ncbi:MAG: CPBP family intramembrane metalloprotease [Candidatus Micrarchaeota archaeon]|nr:CPBP family intramembrane metalloprotease [Candidatus Micrarchaeota archaeon]
MLILYELYQSGKVDINTANFYLTAGLSFFFPLVGLSYLSNKGMNISQILDQLGLSRDKLSIKFVFLGILIFFALFVLELMVNLVSTITNVTINTNVNLLLQSAPIWFYVFTAIIAPVNEEIFFRGVLVPRFGIVLSAIFFGLLHSSYDSTFGIEIIAAIIFGIIAGYVFKKSKSLYPSIIAHVLLNSLAIFAFSMI